MARYKLDYFSAVKPDESVRRKNRHWAATWVAGIVVLVFTMLFFGGLGTAFKYRGEHRSLRQQHDELRLRYDSLYAEKLQADKRLNQLQRQVRFLQQRQDR